MEVPANSRAGRPFALDVLTNSVVFLFCRVALARFANDFVVDLTANSAVSPPWRLLPPRAPVAPLCDGCPCYFVGFASATLVLLLLIFSVFHGCLCYFAEFDVCFSPPASLNTSLHVGGA